MNGSKTPYADIGLSVFLIVVCAAVLWETRKIPPGTFEPLGSAPIPQLVATIIMLLSLLVIANAWLSLKRPTEGSEGEALVLRPVDAGATFLLTLVYVLAMAFGLIGFAIATTLFLFVTIGLLARFRPKGLVLAAAIALLMGFGCEYVFTKIFFVDLPAA
jgi:putative tricarboxylic transport membrane protein